MDFRVLFFLSILCVLPTISFNLAGELPLFGFTTRDASRLSDEHDDGYPDFIPFYSTQGIFFRAFTACHLLRFLITLGVTNINQQGSAADDASSCDEIESIVQ